MAGIKRTSAVHAHAAAHACARTSIRLMCFRQGSMGMSDCARAAVFADSQVTWDRMRWVRQGQDSRPCAHRA